MLTVGNLTYQSRNVNVIFKGKKPGEQVIRVAEQLILSKNMSLGEIVQKAAMLRFRKEIDRASATTTVATAATLMPETGFELNDADDPAVLLHQRVRRECLFQGLHEAAVAHDEQRRD